MLTVLAAGKAAPGVTTSTWALALAWPAKLLTVDCDVAGGDMAPGLLAGRVALDRGLVSWSAAARHGLPVAAAAALLAEHAIRLPEHPDVSLLPGFGTSVQGRSFSTEAWERLAGALSQPAVRHGGDALVDAGRLVSDRGCWPVMRAADRVVLAVRPSVRSVHGAREAVVRLRDQLGDLRTASALVIGRGPYSSKEVASALGLPLFGELPEDAPAAEVLSDGAPWSARAMRRSPLMRAAASLAVELSTPVAPVPVGVAS